MNFYLKSEPSGEICVGELSAEYIEEFKKLYKTNKMSSSSFLQQPFEFNSICHIYGLFTNLKKDLDFKTTYNKVKEYQLPVNEDEKYYLIFTVFDKYSLEFEFEPSEEFDRNKISIDYESFDFKKIKNTLYGKLVGNVISSIKYDENDIQEFKDTELINSGDMNTEVHILQVKNNKSSIVYTYVDNEETWGKIL